MFGSHCGNGKGASFCPFSFGFALGLTGAIMTLLWTAWVLYSGAPEGMSGHMVPVSWGMGFMHAFWIFVKGFVFGVVFVFIYNWIVCRCHAGSCGSSEKK